MVTASITKCITLCFSAHSRVLELLVHCQNLPETWVGQHLSVCRVSDRLGYLTVGKKSQLSKPERENVENLGPLPTQLFICLKNLCGICELSKWSPAPCHVLMTQFKSLPCAVFSALLTHHSKHMLVMPRALKRLRKAECIKTWTWILVLCVTQIILSLLRNSRDWMSEVLLDGYW